MVDRSSANSLLRLLFAITATLLLGACASAPASYPDPIEDPLEDFNRNIHGFNQGLDRTLLRPAANAYGKLPEPIVIGVGNFFDNLRQIRTFINDVLQGKPKRAGNSLRRFVVNTTLGIGGIFDPATLAGMPQHYEGFAQTLAVWGVPSGEYFVIPFLGPATVRDSVGRVFDFFTHPMILYDADNIFIDNIWLVDYVDLRYRLLAADTALDQSLDPYVFLREAYIQRMNFEIYDGDPPIVDFEDEEDWDDEDWEVELD